MYYVDRFAWATLDSFDDIDNVENEQDNLNKLQARIGASQATSGLIG
jgi:hypothetical protein